MRSAEPLEPELAAALEAIDATLAGEPVDPEFAELAELSLILRGERAEADGAFLTSLDERVARRFGVAPRVRRRRGRVSRRRVSWSFGTAGLVAAVIAVAVVIGVGGSSSPDAVNGSSISGRSIAASSGPSTTSHRAASGAAGGAGAAGSAGSAASGRSAAGAPATGSGTATSSSSSKIPAAAPVPRGESHRDVTQSARLTLRASAGALSRVAQEVFDVVGGEHGIVMSSHVTDTAGAPGDARFELRVPSGRLEATLRRLSALGGARVLSREDSSADITASVDGASSRLATARALRRSLLRQLAAAFTSTEVDHLQAALRRNLAEIGGDETALARLETRVSLSAIAVEVSSPAPPVHARGRRGAGGFSIGRGLHDAGRVLVVSAAVALIVLAVLVPLGALAGIAAWVWAFAARRRREAALGP